MAKKSRAVAAALMAAITLSSASGFFGCSNEGDTIANVTPDENQSSGSSEIVYAEESGYVNEALLYEGISGEINSALASGGITKEKYEEYMSTLDTFYKVHGLENNHKEELYNMTKYAYYKYLTTETTNALQEIVTTLQNEGVTYEDCGNTITDLAAAQVNINGELYEIGEFTVEEYKEAAAKEIDDLNEYFVNSVQNAMSSSEIVKVYYEAFGSAVNVVNFLERNSTMGSSDSEELFNTTMDSLNNLNEGVSTETTKTEGVSVDANGNKVQTGSVSSVVKRAFEVLTEENKELLGLEGYTLDELNSEAQEKIINLVKTDKYFANTVIGRVLDEATEGVDFAMDSDNVENAAYDTITDGLVTIANLEAMINSTTYEEPTISSEIEDLNNQTDEVNKKGTAYGEKLSAYISANPDYLTYLESNSDSITVEINGKKLSGKEFAEVVRNFIKEYASETSTAEISVEYEPGM